MTRPRSHPRRAPLAALAAVLALGGLALACNDATAPLQMDAYDYKVAVPGAKGGVDSVAFHWTSADLPVKVWVEDAAGVPALVQKALDRWGATIGSGKFRGTLVGDSTTADIIVHVAQPPVAEFAVTRLHALATSCEGAADVFLDPAQRTIQRPLRVYVFTSADPAAPDVRACLDATTTHEIGHTLGLFQHSPNAEDVMYRLPTTAEPTLHDRATAYFLYRDASGLTAVRSGTPQ
ncbi:MAG TPA: hypothetical protein VFS40_00885 [Gemmatimonadales bacterium]|nr:hypothetical protein [Gemmatimonadales bacterium]